MRTANMVTMNWCLSRKKNCMKTGGVIFYYVSSRSNMLSRGRYIAQTTLKRRANKAVFRNLSTRWTVTSSAPTFENMPGDFEMRMEEQSRMAADTVNFFNEKYAVAHQFNPKSPMIKFNAMGIPSVILFSHDLVKDWQAYELAGQTKRYCIVQTSFICVM